MSVKSKGWRYQPVYTYPNDERIITLCEVHFDRNGFLRLWTKDFATVPQGESAEELSRDLVLMLACLWKWHPVDFSALHVGMEFAGTGVDVENMLGAMNKARRMDLLG